MIMTPSPPQTWARMPGISVLCPTYGRVGRLPGLMMSFLQQDYAGPSELIILNDRHDQALTLDAPACVAAAPEGMRTKNLSMINAPQQFASLGEKRNRLLELAVYPYVAWWDDDDRYLPGHLTKALGLIRQGFRGSMQSHVWLNDGKVLTCARPHSPFCNAVMEKQAILDAGGFPAQQMRADLGNVVMVIGARM